jgi:putative membrane protein
MMGFYGHGGGFGWIGMLVGGVFALALLIGFIVLVVWAVRRMSGNTAHPGAQLPAGQSAKDIAQVRYAKGEITREEYQQLLTDLGK